MRDSRGEYVVFLDADDRLMENGLEVGVRTLDAHPHCAFAYGHVRLIGADGSLLSVPDQTIIKQDHYVELLRHNYIWTVGAVIYRRDIIVSAGRFNSLINPSADYDLNIRLAQKFQVHCHGEVVLEYRRHGSNMTSNLRAMLASAVTARRNHRKYVKGNRRYEAALKEGTASVQKYYGERLVSAVRDQIHNYEMKQALSGVFTLLRFYPKGFAKHAGRKILRVLKVKDNLISLHKTR